MLYPNSRLKFPNYHTPTPKSHTINTLIICSDLITTSLKGRYTNIKPLLRALNNPTTPSHQLCDSWRKAAPSIPWYWMKKDTGRPTASAIIWYGYIISTDDGDHTNSCKSDCAMRWNGENTFGEDDSVTNGCAPASLMPGCHSSKTMNYSAAPVHSSTTQSKRNCFWLSGIRMRGL